MSNFFLKYSLTARVLYGKILEYYNRGYKSAGRIPVERAFSPNELFSSSTYGFAVLDAGGKFLQWNPALTGMLAVSDDALRNVSFLEFMPSSKAASFRHFLRTIGKTGRESCVAVLPFTSGNRTGWWKLEISSTEDLSAESANHYCIIEDITNQQKSEEYLRNSVKIALKETKSRSEFLANMSHEIRTPIHTVVGMTELLLETELDEEQREYAQQTHYAADILLGIVNDILDFSKIEAGKLSLDIIECDIVSLAEEALGLLSLEAHKKGLELILDSSEARGNGVRGDPVRIRQIMMNLVSNAVKFTERGEVFFRLSTNRERDGRIKLDFSVSDTGIGISPDTLGRLFSPFTQADSTTTRKFGGTGLGLVITRNLIEMMKGQLFVKSEEGIGSTFTVSLPLECGENPEKPVSEMSLRGTRILLIDDNERSLEVTRCYLESFGCEVRSVLSGKEALDVLRSEPAHGSGEPAADSKPLRGWDICIIDQFMQGMDGWQLASEINADKTLNSVKLILMSPAGLSGNEAKMKLLKWFDGYLIKPIRQRDLFFCIENVLEQELDLDMVEGELLPLDDDPVEKLMKEQPLRVLLAEDHVVNQVLMKTILEKLGHRVDIVASGKEVLTQIERAAYDIVFMDIHMPELNGFETTRILRDRGYRMPIVAVSATVVKEELEEALEIGMNACLSKPFRKSELLDVLGKVRSATMRESVIAGTVRSESRAGSSVEVFNYEELLTIFEGNSTVVKRIVEIFLSKIDLQLGAMKSALERMDRDTIRLEAHSIKGASLNLSAGLLAASARTLEDASEKSDMRDA